MRTLNVKAVLLCAGFCSLPLPAFAQETPSTPEVLESDPPAPKKKQSTLEKIGRIGSDSLGPFMVVSGIGVATDGDFRSRRLGRSAMAIATTGALTVALKEIVQEERPNKADRHSFPSGHASLAFSTATILDAYKPGWKGAGYAWATWISLSRVPVKAHYLHDVAAGALLGHVVTKAFTRNYRGEENEIPINAPAALPQSWVLRAAEPAGPQDRGKWNVGLSPVGLSVSKRW